MMIQDPLDTNNNVGRNTFRIKEILQTFVDAFAGFMAIVVRGSQGQSALSDFFQFEGSSKG